MLENLKHEKGIFWIIPVALLLYTMFGIQGWSALGLAFTGYYIFILVERMGKTIPIIELMTVMAALQWILGPFIDYHNEVTHYKYHMYITEEQYMAYVVPAIFAFRLGTLFFKDQSVLGEIGVRVKSLLYEYPELPYLLIAGGLVSPILGKIMPNALAFVFFLLANLKYVGAIYLLFSDKPNRWPVFFGVMSITAMASLASGMFHDLLLWVMLTFTFVAKELSMSRFMKITLTVIGVVFSMSIQAVKQEYRSIIQNGYSANRLVLFSGLVADNWRSGRIVTPTSDENMNARLNQGWIISAVMRNVPAFAEYADGGTIIEGIEAALLPRFLAPNKKMAGGQENFIKYTGLLLSEGTSMGISLAGEGYANYGRYGGLMFMFIWGIFVGWVWSKLYVYSQYYPTLLIWSPIIFLQVVKAETEFVVVLNHMIKTGVLVFGLLWGVKKQWGIRL